MHTLRSALSEPENQDPVTRIRPRRLRVGDRVRLVSPAGSVDRDRVARGVEILRGWGLSPEVSEAALGVFEFYSAPREQRLRDLELAFTAPEVRGVFCTRGGYGSGLVVDELLDCWQQDPKPFLGYSDNTFLHLAAARSGVVSFYGPSLAWDDSKSDEASAAQMRRLLMDDSAGMTWTPSPFEATSAIGSSAGAAVGRLAGGNVTILASACGTSTQPRFDGCLLVIEDVRELPFRLHRALTQLTRSGATAGVVGVVVGQFTECIGPSFQPDVMAVVSDWCEGLGVPFLGGFSIGHGANQCTVPFGVRAELDVEAGTLTLLEHATVL